MLLGQLEHKIYETKSGKNKPGAKFHYVQIKIKKLYDKDSGE